MLNETSLCDMDCTKSGNKMLTGKKNQIPRLSLHAIHLLTWYQHRKQHQQYLPPTESYPCAFLGDS